MKKLLLIFTLFLSFTFSAFSQLSVNSSDSFYSHVESWEMRGLISDVPPLRPFPLKNILSILETVIEKGDERDSGIAKYYYEYLTNKKWYLDLDTESVFKTSDLDSEGKSFDFLISTTPSFKGDLFLYKDFISLGYDFGINLKNSINEADFLPMYTNSQKDAIYDFASIGKAHIFLDSNNIVSFGSKNIFTQFGIYRTGYGNFLNEGLVLNDTAYHSSNVSFTYLTEKLSYAQQISVVGATTNSFLNDEITESNKMISFHQLSYKFSPRFSMSYYETIVFGRRFDISYVLPVSFLLAQSLNGNNDNLQLGLSFKYNPIDEIMWVTDFFVDYLNFSELLKFNFESKNSFAFKSGFIYTPKNSFCTRFSFNYTLLSPYIYTHVEYEDETSDALKTSTINYQNYTNNGYPIGASYEPNSDAINFSLDFVPISRLHLKVLTTFMRHGNVCENYTDSEAVQYLMSDYGIYNTSGGFFTHANYGNSLTGNPSVVPTAWNSMNFINQEHVMYLIQAGINADYSFKPVIKEKIHISLKLSYMFEFIHNYGIQNEIYPGVNAVANDSNNDGIIDSFSVGDTYFLNASQLVDFYRNKWIDKLEDKINHYFTIGICIKF